jgi:NitT/TauT family transport system permease protein
MTSSTLTAALRPVALSGVLRPIGRGVLAVSRRSAAVLAFLAAWQLLPPVLLSEEKQPFLPRLSVVLGALRDLAASGELADHVLISVQRSALGFGIAVLIAVPLGLLVGWYSSVAQVLGPLLEVFRNTAALALLPVFTLLLGIGETSKIALIVYACSWALLLNTISGVRSVDPLLVKSARSLGLTDAQLFRSVVLPSALPAIFTGIRLAGAASILVLIAAEMVGAKSGLGYLINNAQFSFQIPQMYAGIVATSVLGVSVNYALVRLERHFSQWRTT